MRLFISYSRDDKTYVYALKDELQTDYPVWIDTQLVGGTQWWESILKEIEAADCVIAVLSQRAVDSIYCRAELDYALALNKPVLPLLIKACDYPKSLNDRHIQYIDNIGAMDLQKVLRLMERAIGRIQLEIERGNFQPRSEPRPALPEPPPNAPQHAYEIFAAAEEAAAQDDLTLAETLFNKVMKADPQGLGLAAVERLAEIRAERDRAIAYLNVAKMATNPTTLKGARAAWRMYVQKYGREHDPQILAALLDDATPAVGTPFLASAAPPPALTPGSRRADDKGVPMVYVPPGTLLMGSTPQQVEEAFAQAQKDYKDAKREWYERELPQHEVVIASGFWLDLTPVTNESYARFIKEGGYKERALWTPGGWEWVQKNKTAGPKEYDKFGDPQQPRVGVTWFEAYAYCQWREGRLPTEAEWEWAARGPENRIYPWSNMFDANRVIYDKNSGGKTSPVGSGVRTSGASWVGALDMSGNVWEWCNTLYQPYPYRADDGREGFEDSTNFRVLRGGSWWNDFTSVLRAPYRGWNFPNGEISGGGFRGARSYSSES